MAKRTPPEKSGKKRYSFPRAVQEEQDPEWKSWFLQVERNINACRDPKRKRIIYTSVEKEGKKNPLIRRKTSPTPLAKFIRNDAKKSGRNLSMDIELIRTIWNVAVGKEFAEETKIYSFKDGVLTISVSSSTLYQEIRQFYQEHILEELRAVWQISIPLLRIEYKMGKN